MLELISISKKFDSEIFSDYSFKFTTNKIYHLKGRNGSGKSTLLKMIKGIYLHDEGNIIFTFGKNKKDDVVYIDGNFRSFFHRMSVKQNLEYFFSLLNKEKNLTYLNNLIAFFKISELQNKKFSSLSQGQMQLISVIRGLSSNSKVLLLDEVFSSLDTSYKEIVSSYLLEYVKKNEALVIFTSHDNHFKNTSNFEEICLN